MTIAIYAVCLVGGYYANRKATWFHPVGWAGVALLTAGIISNMV